MTELKPFFGNVQKIYDDDHSTELVRLFLDPEMVYSCAYFERDDMTLAEAQIAKLDLSLGKCDLRPGQTLLDIGCGWGGCMCRAASKYGVNVIGLTLSEGQAAYCARKIAGLGEGGGEGGGGVGRAEVRVQGWEEFTEPVDRIISIGAFEHFRAERCDAFFTRCREILPPGATMMLHTIVAFSFSNLKRLGVELTHENVLFAKFIARQIFPGGQLMDPDRIIEHAEAAGFRLVQDQSLQSHYARTLDTWAVSLRARRTEAIEIASVEMYDRFMKYLTGCADHFRSGHIDLRQFTLRAS